MPDEPGCSDFPAAHSMDTMWFAIDANGHVALFDSGEGGCVPDDAEDNGYDVIRELAALNPEPKPDPPAGQHIQSLPFGNAIMRGEAARFREHADEVEPFGPASCFVSFEYPLVEEPLPASAKPGFFARLFGARPATPLSSPAVLDETKMKRFDRIHELGLCGGCEVAPPGDEDLAHEPERASRRLGIYVYACPGSIAEPYERVASPDRPFDGSALRDRMSKFTGSFADRALLQPAEHWEEIQSWSATWIDTDGQRHCVPGREDDYQRENPDADLDLDPPRD